MWDGSANGPFVAPKDLLGEVRWHHHGSPRLLVTALGPRDCASVLPLQFLQPSTEYCGVGTLAGLAGRWSQRRREWGALHLGRQGAWPRPNTSQTGLALARWSWRMVLAARAYDGPAASFVPLLPLSSQRTGFGSARWTSGKQLWNGGALFSCTAGRKRQRSNSMGTICPLKSASCSRHFLKTPRRNCDPCWQWHTLR
jgi:hypothetical protein